jgi:thiol:disulfide interchange protein DsbD
MGTLRSRTAAFLTASALAGAGYLFFLQEPLSRSSLSSAHSSANQDEEWEPFSPERLASARASGKPVFIDFTAEWCLNCKVNERVTLSRADVQAAFKKHNVVMLKADWTNADPAITAELNRFNRVGVPFYLLYSPNVAEPKVFPELLTPSLVLEALEALPLP